MPLKEIPFFKGYALRFNWYGFEQLMVGLNAPAFTDFDKAISKLGPKEMRVIIWAGLLHQNPGLTPDDVYGLIDEYLDTHNINDLSEVIMKALSEASVIGGNDTGEAKGQATPVSTRLPI